MIQLDPKKLSSTTEAFRKVDTESCPNLTYDALHWWRSVGYVLAILLDKASYSTQAQCRLLKFIRAITPSLGPARVPGRLRWKSFMTDDHSPIELSWDWRTGDDQHPKIRFSLEPVGILAGTHIDPDNEYETYALQATIFKFIPNTDMEWLRHFQKQFNVENSRGWIEGHPSKEFYAFDLSEDGIVGKAYFFPGFKARSIEQSNFDVVLGAIHTAPGSSPEKLEALNMFREYVYNPSSPLLEMDMLAIDLVDPTESRFKIYFRVRDTSFACVKETMTLGNRIQKPGLERGIEVLRQLYHTLLRGGEDEVGDRAQLPPNDHRTAGILYNVEFKYGSKSPKVKAYLPVRHYARSEEAIMTALNAHLHNAHSFAKNSIANYSDALETIL